MHPINKLNIFFYSTPPQELSKIEFLNWIKNPQGDQGIPLLSRYIETHKPKEADWVELFHSLASSDEQKTLALLLLEGEGIDLFAYEPEKQVKLWLEYPVDIDAGIAIFVQIAAKLKPAELWIYALSLYANEADRKTLERVFLEIPQLKCVAEFPDARRLCLHMAQSSPELAFDLWKQAGMDKSLGKELFTLWQETQPRLGFEILRALKQNNVIAPYRSWLSLYPHLTDDEIFEIGKLFLKKGDPEEILELSTAYAIQHQRYQSGAAMIHLAIREKLGGRDVHIRCSQALMGSIFNDPKHHESQLRALFLSSDGTLILYETLILSFYLRIQTQSDKTPWLNLIQDLLIAGKKLPVTSETAPVVEALIADLQRHPKALTALYRLLRDENAANRELIYTIEEIVLDQMWSRAMRTQKKADWEEALGEMAALWKKVGLNRAYRNRRGVLFARVVSQFERNNDARNSQRNCRVLQEPLEDVVASWIEEADCPRPLKQRIVLACSSYELGAKLQRACRGQILSHSRGFLDSIDNSELYPFFQRHLFGTVPRINLPDDQFDRLCDSMMLLQLAPDIKKLDEYLSVFQYLTREPTLEMQAWLARHLVAHNHKPSVVISFLKHTVAPIGPLTLEENELIAKVIELPLEFETFTQDYTLFQRASCDLSKLLVRLHPDKLKASRWCSAPTIGAEILIHRTRFLDASFEVVHSEAEQVVKLACGLIPKLESVDEKIFILEKLLNHPSYKLQRRLIGQTLLLLAPEKPLWVLDQLSTDDQAELLPYDQGALGPLITLFKKLAACSVNADQLLAMTMVMSRLKEVKTHPVFWTLGAYHFEMILRSNDVKPTDHFETVGLILELSNNEYPFRNLSEFNNNLIECHLQGTKSMLGNIQLTSHAMLLFKLSLDRLSQQDQNHPEWAELVIKYATVAIRIKLDSEIILQLIRLMDPDSFDPQCRIEYDPYVYPLGALWINLTNNGTPSDEQVQFLLQNRTLVFKHMHQLADEGNRTQKLLALRSLNIPQTHTDDFLEFQQFRLQTMREVLEEAILDINDDPENLKAQDYETIVRKAGKILKSLTDADCKLVEKEALIEFYQLFAEFIANEMIHGNGVEAGKHLYEYFISASSNPHLKMHSQQLVLHFLAYGTTIVFQHQLTPYRSILIQAMISVFASMNYNETEDLDAYLIGFAYRYCLYADKALPNVDETASSRLLQPLQNGAASHIKQLVLSRQEHFNKFREGSVIAKISTIDRELAPMISWFDSQSDLTPLDTQELPLAIEMIEELSFYTFLDAHRMALRLIQRIKQTNSNRNKYYKDLFLQIHRLTDHPSKIKEAYMAHFKLLSLDELMPLCREVYPLRFGSTATEQVSSINEQLLATIGTAPFKIEFRFVTQNPAMKNIVSSLFKLCKQKANTIDEHIEFASSHQLVIRQIVQKNSLTIFEFAALLSQITWISQSEDCKMIDTGHIRGMLDTLENETVDKDKKTLIALCRWDCVDRSQTGNLSSDLPPLKQRIESEARQTLPRL